MTAIKFYSNIRRQFEILIKDNQLEEMEFDEDNRKEFQGYISPKSTSF